MELHRERVSSMKCAACKASASRTVVARKNGQAKARYPVCTVCYNRHLRGGDVWKTSAFSERERAIQRADAQQLVKEGNSVREIAEVLKVCVSTVRNRLRGK